MAKIRGNDLILFIQKDGKYKAYAYSTTCEIDIQAETIKVGSPDTGRWIRKKKRRLSWNTSCGYLISTGGDTTELFKMLVDKTPVMITLGSVKPHTNIMDAADYTTDGRLSMQGEGLLTRMTITGKKGDFVTMSIEIAGCGELDVLWESSITVAPANIVALSAGKVYPVVINSTGSWSVLNNDAWIIASPISGDNGVDMVNITVAKNPGDARSGKIIFENNDSRERATVIVNQDEDAIKVTPSEITAPSKYGEYNIILKSNANWYCKNTPGWISADVTRGNAGTHSINIIVSENTGTSDRVGTVVFSIVGEDITAELTVNQSSATIESDIDISPADLLNVLAAGETRAVQVKSAGAWNVSYKPAWINITPSSGTAGSEKVNATIAPNTGAARSEVVTFENSDAQKEVELSVFQLEGTPKFEAVPSDIENVPASGGTRTVQLYCTDDNWVLTYAPTWITVSPDSGTDDTVLTVTIASNLGASRNDVIQIDNLGTGVTLEIGVYQLGASSGKYLNVSDYYYNTNGIAGSIQIGVDTNVDDLIIEVAGDYPYWLEDAFLSASGDTLNILYAANSNSTPQFATIKFVSEKYPEVNKDFYAINGAPAGIDYSVLIPPGDGGVIEQERSAGTIKTYLFDNVTTYLDDEGTFWFSGLDYDPEPGNGKIVKIYPKANTTSAERIARLICKRGYDDEILSNVEVRQGATGYYIEYDGTPNVLVSSSAFTVNRTITVGTSIPNNPTAASEATWINNITVTPMENDDFGVQFKIAENGTGVERNGTVRVTFMDVHYDFSITQRK